MPIQLTSMVSPLMVASMYEFGSLELVCFHVPVRSAGWGLGSSFLVSVFDVPSVLAGASDVVFSRRRSVRRATVPLPAVRLSFSWFSSFLVDYLAEDLSVVFDDLDGDVELAGHLVGLPPYMRSASAYSAGSMSSRAVRRRQRRSIRLPSHPFDVSSSCAQWTSSCTSVQRLRV